MRSDIKYIGTGLLIGSIVAVLAITCLFMTGLLQPGASSVQIPETVIPYEQPADSIFVPVVTMQTPTFVPTSMPTMTPMPVSPTPDVEAALADQIDQSLLTYGGDWNIVIRADGSRTVYSHNSDQIVHVASIIKVPIAMLFFKSLEEKGILPAEYDSYLSTRGVGRTYQQLLKAMLVESEEDATGTLRTIITDSKIDVAAALLSWGAIHTDLGKRRSTPDDIARLYESLYFGKAITPEGRKIILDYMAAYTVNDDTRLGVIRPSLPSGAEFYNKRGSVTSGVLIIGDSALFAWPQDGNKKVFVVVILGYMGDPPVSDVTLVKGIEAMANQFWSFVAPKPPLR